MMKLLSIRRISLLENVSGLSATFVAGLTLGLLPLMLLVRLMATQ